MWTIATWSAPVWSATSAIACAWSESLGTVRKNSPPSGNPSSASALAVGEHANVPDDTISSSVLSAIVDDPGPTMTSTSRARSDWIAVVADPVVLPSSATTERTGTPITPPARLIRSIASSAAATMGSPTTVSPVGSRMPTTRRPSLSARGGIVVVVAATDVVGTASPPLEQPAAPSPATRATAIRRRRRVTTMQRRRGGPRRRGQGRHARAPRMLSTSMPPTT